jgi:ubiquinone/menaquinone biosynthesis C-methylase UbiE
MENLPERLRTSGAIEIKKRLGRISGGNILDVATGSGDFINTLMKMLKDYDRFVGIEISREDLESAKKQFEGQPVEFLEMNAEYLRFDDNSFDTVCISYALHHLESVERVLAEMKRVLKPGGCFVVQEEFSDGEQSEAQKTDILRHHWDSEIDSMLGTVHHRTFTKQRIKDIMDGQGLSELETFESTHSVKCLICDRKFECDPRKGKGEITLDQFAKKIDDNLHRLDGRAGLEIRERLKKEGERLKERMRKHGVAAASNLFLIGRK